MTNKEKIGAFTGMILGDGYIDKYNSFRLIHCEAQKNYLFFKTEILQKFQKPLLIPQFFNNNGYPGWRVSTRSCPTFRIFRKKIYKGKKTISRSILNRLTTLGIAIWFMDDGSTSFRRRLGKITSVETTLNTYISREQNEIIIKYFAERWNIKWGLNKSGNSYRLRMGTIEARKFIKIIEPFVIDSMKYKTKKLLT